MTATPLTMVYVEIRLKTAGCIIYTPLVWQLASLPAKINPVFKWHSTVWKRLWNIIWKRNLNAKLVTYFSRRELQKSLDMQTKHNTYKKTAQFQSRYYISKFEKLFFSPEDHSKLWFKNTCRLLFEDLPRWQGHRVRCFIVGHKKRVCVTTIHLPT